MNARYRLLFVLSLIVLLSLITAPAVPAQHWSRSFGAMGLDFPGSGDGEAYCFATHGNKLVVGGWFEEAGDVVANHVALWDGEKWEAMAGGINQIPSFVVGTPYSIYVGGSFWEVDGEPWTYCARWGEGSWHQMPGLLQAPTCGTMVDGFLWVGGSFTRETTPPWWIGMKRWSSDHWVDPDDFGSWDLYEDEAHAIGDGFDLIHLGGEITRDIVGGTTYNHVGWNADDGHVEFGEGITGGHVECFESEGSFMWVGGTFTHADGQESRGLVEQGAGGTYFPVAQASTPRQVWDMTMRGEALYLVADEGTPEVHEWVVRRYNAGTWSASLGGPFTDGLNCIENLNGDLYVGGFFKNGVVRWDEGDDEWVHLGGGIGLVNHDRHWFRALVEFEGDIVAAGEQISLPAVLRDQINCQNVVRWDGEAWHRMGDGLPSDVTGLAVHEGQLYASMQYSPGLDRVQRWTGTTWEGVGDFDNQVLCLAVFGDELVAGGFFTAVDGQPAGRVAAFDGASWRALGDGMDGEVRVLFDNDGSLYAGGDFATADGDAAARVARWNGTTWTGMGQGFDDGEVHALSAYAQEIYAGGSFTAAGGVACSHVARWDGAQWQPLGDGVGGDTYYGVAALRGTTAGLYVGGDFTTAGAAPAGGLARWDGAWSEFEGGVSGSYQSRATVSALLVHEGDLWVAGHFQRVDGNIPSYCIAQWDDGTLVPTLLTSFDAEPGGDGTVRLSWQVAAPLVEAEFRLMASANGRQWLVPYVPAAGDRFTAHDAAPDLAGAASVDYELAYRDDGAWRELGAKSVPLSLPSAVRLHAAAPNPFNPITRISFELDREQEVRLDVHDLAGRRLATLLRERLPAGRHAAVWRGCDDTGRALPSGTYLVRLITDQAVRTRKVVLAR